MQFFQVEIQPRLSDFDLYGHLNNTHYGSYTEVALYNIMVNELGCDPARYGAVTRHLSFDFRKPIRFGTPVAIRIRITEIANARLNVEYEFVDASNPNKVFATGNRTVVHISLENGRPAPVPESVMEVYRAKCLGEEDRISTVA
jgi:acyl-CoA thioester hydrolase